MTDLYFLKVRFFVSIHFKMFEQIQQKRGKKISTKHKFYKDLRLKAAPEKCEKKALQNS